MIIVWLKFFICAVVIYFAGSNLAKYGDAIGEKTGLCRAWIGIVLLAAVTSLPELANGVSAVAITNSPDLAVGDILGACMINIFTLACLDILFGIRRKQSVFLNVEKGNKQIAIANIVFLLFIAFGLAASHYYFNLQIWGISIYAVIIFVVYLILQKVLYSSSDHGVELKEADKKYSNLPVSKIYLTFAFLSLVVIIAGGWLPAIGNEIVEVMGWGRTFVAVLFLGIATTLPEATVSLTALRLKQVGMSIGNLVGSNVFDIALLFIFEIFYYQGSIFAAASFNMIYAAIFGAILALIAYFAMVKKVTSHFSSYLIILVYVLSLFFLYKISLI